MYLLYGNLALLSTGKKTLLASVVFYVVLVADRTKVVPTQVLAAQAVPLLVPIFKLQRTLAVVLRQCFVMC